jgi:uncharacterized protein YciI
MHFMVLGWDRKEPNRVSRRDAARPAHLAKMAELRQAGHVIFGAPLLDDGDTIIGSLVVTDFDSRSDLDAWLAVEPLNVEGVWGEIIVQPCRVGDTYLDQLRPQPD